MSAWKLVVNAGDQPSVAISQVVQGTLKRAGINIDLDMKEGSEFVETMLQGRFDAIFGGVATSRSSRPGWPPTASTAPSTTRCSERRIRIPEYVEAIERVNTTLGTGAGGQGRL